MSTIRRRPGAETPEPEAQPDASASPRKDVPRTPAEAQETAPEPFERPRREKLDLSGLDSLLDMDKDDLARLMNAMPSRFEVGDAVEGKVTRIGKETVFVDIGSKSEALLDRSEAQDLALDDTVKAYVVGTDELGIRISKRVSGAAASALLATAQESGMPVEGKVVGANKGGFDIRVGDARAFCPISHMDRQRIENPEVYLGQTLTFQVIETGDKVVVSRRKILEQESRDKAASFWATVKEGDEHRGTVRSVQKFGVFVDLGGVDGLVPTRELGWGTSDPSAMAPGQVLSVRIIEIDRARQRLTLSAKDPNSSPWARVGQDFVVGGVYPGTVRSLTEFGAFVELAPGLQGLLHKSRMGKGEKPKVSTTLDVRLDDVDHERQRLSLSAPDAPEAENPDEWRSAQPPASSGSFGTFADLMGSLKKKD